MDQILNDERLVLSDLRARGIDSPGLVHISWEKPRLEAIPILCQWLEESIDPRVKHMILITLSQKWAIGPALPALLEILERTTFPAQDEAIKAYEEALVSAICSAPNAKLWPRILGIARRPDLGRLRAHPLRRAGRFKTHADEVLDLYGEFVGSDSVYIEVAICEGLRLLGDPRGVAILEQVRDLTSHVLRAKARTLDRLSGR